MDTWITLLMIVDGVMELHPDLDRREFCVGNIVPDCNVENEDWTTFTPAREVTHWMHGEKIIPKCDRMREIHALEAEYLRDNPNSGYMTEILPLKEFSDYIDYLPTDVLLEKSV